jgi:protein-S-isoprenylcysteine O-methyltransferase Ste14
MREYNLLQAIFFKARGVLMVPPLVFLGVFFRWEWELEWAVWTLGLSIFLLGVALRVWAQQHLRYRLPEAERGLATSGPYAFMRNPVYIANMLMFAGLCVLCELPWAIPLVCAWAFIVYNIGIRFEEHRLRKRYGEAYTEFCERTPRWIPHRPVWLAVRAAPAASLPCALRAEWQCLSLLLIPIAKELISQRYIE